MKTVYKVLTILSLASILGAASFQPVRATEPSKEVKKERVKEEKKATEKDNCDYSSRKEMKVWDDVTINPVSYSTLDSTGTAIAQESNVRVKGLLHTVAIIPYNGGIEIDLPLFASGKVKEPLRFQAKDIHTGRIYDFNKDNTFYPGDNGIEAGRFEILLIGSYENCETTSAVMEAVYEKPPKVIETEKIKVIENERIVEKRVYVPVPYREPTHRKHRETRREQKCLAERVADLWVLRTIANHTDANLTSRAGDLNSDQEEVNWVIGGKLSGQNCSGHNWRLFAEYLKTDGYACRINSKGRQATSDIANNQFTIEALGVLSTNGVNSTNKFGGVARVIFNNYSTGATSEIVVPDQNGDLSIAKLHTGKEVNGIKYELGPAYVAGNLTRDYVIINAVVEGIHQAKKNTPSELRIGHDRTMLPYNYGNLVESGWGYVLKAEARKDFGWPTLGAGASFENAFTELKNGNDSHKLISDITTKEYRAFIEALLDVVRGIQLYGQLDYVKENHTYENSGTITETDSHGYEAQVGVNIRIPVGGKKNE